MKTLIIINEPFAEMALGRNTSLAYILACVALKHEVYIFNLKNLLPKKTAPVFHLTSNKALCEALVQNYKKANLKIVDCVAAKNLEKLLKIKVQKVGEFLPKKITLKSLKLSEVDFIIQRLEPMKSPFPPAGKKNIDDVLTHLKKLFPQLIFNCPINLGDKELPQQINKILGKKIATPTAEFKLGQNVANSVKSMAQDYQKLYKTKEIKLVFKPKNSAQSLGVFAVEFSEKGDDFLTLKKQKISELKAKQTYQIKKNLDEKELKKIIEILCFVQNAESSQSLSELTQSQIINKAKILFNQEVLVQPFLRGVKFGDIRVNFFKNQKGDFYVAGQAFRKSLQKEGENFTTAFSTGGAAPQPIEALQKSEIKNLFSKNAAILKILNGKLRQKYRDVIELGADFILVGDGKNILLGEINHHCQGLVPLSEAMAKAVNKDAFYEGGLGLATSAVKSWKRKSKINGQIS
jgi:hypothetical protein